MKPLNEFYDSLLGSLNCHIDEDTREVTTLYDGEHTPVYVKKKQLLAMNHELSKNGFDDIEKQTVFHPLSESATAAQMSEVHHWLLMAIRIRLNSLLATVAARIIDIATSPKLQAKMKASEVANYTCLNDADSKTLENLHKIIDNMDITNSTRSLVHLRVKRGGTLNGKTFGRVVYVTFPILDEFENEDSVIFDQKVRKKDMVVLKTLFQDVILNGKGGKAGDFSAANTSTTAPALSAMLIAYYNVLVRLNSLYKAHGKVLDNTGLPVDISWYPAISDFSSLRLMVPQLPGNIGSGDPKKSEKVQVEDAPVGTESDYSGINKPVEQPRSAAVDESNAVGSFLKAKPIAGAIAIHSSKPQMVDPLTQTVSNEINPEELSPEEYSAYRMNQQMYSMYNNPNNPAANQFVRGRDAFLAQQNQYENPYSHDPYGVNNMAAAPVAGGGAGLGEPIGFSRNGNPLYLVNGQPVEVTPVAGGGNNGMAQPQPAGPTTGNGRFSEFT